MQRIKKFTTKGNNIANLNNEKQKKKCIAKQQDESESEIKNKSGEQERAETSQEKQEDSGKTNNIAADESKDQVTDDFSLSSTDESVSEKLSKERAIKNDKYVSNMIKLRAVNMHAEFEKYVFENMEKYVICDEESIEKYCIRENPNYWSDFMMHLKNLDWSILAKNYDNKNSDDGVKSPARNNTILNK